MAGDELLWRHVGDGAAASGIGWASRCVGAGDGAFVGGAGGVEVGLIEVDAAGEAEVEDLDEAAVGEHDVGGLEVAMEDAEGVGGGETVGDLDAGGEDELEGGGSLGDYFVEGLAGDVLHDDVGFVDAVGLLGGEFAYFIDGADVGVVDGGGEPGFAELGGAHLHNGESAAFEELEDDWALEKGVGGEEDDSAAARTDLTNELVVLNCPALHGSLLQGLGLWMLQKDYLWGRWDWKMVRSSVIWSGASSRLGMGIKPCWPR